MGSVSSADEGDIEMVMSGEHQHYFKVLQLIRNFDQMKQNQLVKADKKDNTFLKRLKKKLSLMCSSKK